MVPTIRRKYSKPFEQQCPKPPQYPVGGNIAGSRHRHQCRWPHVLILWCDDVGWWNVGAFNHGMMGYKTPNIDRIAKEGAMFTDWYGQQSCTAGRSTFITGQSPFRTSLLKVGLPGAKEGLQKEDVTIAELLKAQGYATGHFGKNHLGDQDEHLPTARSATRSRGCAHCARRGVERRKIEGHARLPHQ